MSSCYMIHGTVLCPRPISTIGRWVLTMMFAGLKVTITTIGQRLGDFGLTPTPTQIGVLKVNLTMVLLSSTLTMLHHTASTQEESST